jgi:hypothetical protein
VQRVIIYDAGALVAAERNVRSRRGATSAVRVTLDAPLERAALPAPRAGRDASVP